MKSVSVTTRRRLEIQGFVGLDDATLAEAGPWLRLAPIVCMVWAAIGTWRASPAIPWLLMPFAALGAVLPGHPFDAIYHFGFRRLLGTRPLPRYGAPRRFACAVATVWLGVTGWAFYQGLTGLGYALGILFCLTALVPATTDFCVPSCVYGLLFGKPAACRK